MQRRIARARRLVEWEGDTSKCGRYTIQTGHERHGPKWERYLELWIATDPSGVGPPWRNAGSLDTRREIKALAELEERKRLGLRT